MYFPPLVWDNILDYLGIWENAYNKVVKDIPKAWRDLPVLPTQVGFYYTKGCCQDDTTELFVIQRQIREANLLSCQKGYNIATYWIEPYIRHHNRVIRAWNCVEIWT